MKNKVRGKMRGELKSTKKQMPKMPKRERGMVLVISMIMLLILTIVSLSSSQSVLMQEKMTGSSREAALALLAAESGLKDAEEWIDTLNTVSTFNPNGTDGEYAKNAGPDRSTYFIEDTGPFSDATKYKVAKVDVSPTINSVDNAQALARYFVVDMGEFEIDAVDSGANDLNFGIANSEAQAGSGHAFLIASMGMSRDRITRRVIRSYYRKNL